VDFLPGFAVALSATFLEAVFLLIVLAIEFIDVGKLILTGARCSRPEP
jgi:hypothetical protein